MDSDFLLECVQNCLRSCIHILLHVDKHYGDEGIFSSSYRANTTSESHAKRQGPGQEAGHSQARVCEEEGERLAEGRGEEERRGSGVGRGRDESGN
jgi:hypothetical protein